MFSNPQNKTTAEIAHEWDAIAPTRIEQILSGRDITFDFVLSPAINLLLENGKYESILDAGCGVGVMTDRLSGRFKKSVGIDPSEKSIEIANFYFGRSTKFLATTLENYVNSTRSRYDVVLANMVLMDVLKLDAFLNAVSRVLKPGGVFIFSITHPFFWPDYYGYKKEKWFDYNKELIIESPFRISSQPDCRLISTHIHRPISQYFTSFGRNGLPLEDLIEPMPALAVNEMYPTKWKYPRYMLGRSRKAKIIGRRKI